MQLDRTFDASAPHRVIAVVNPATRRRASAVVDVLRRAAPAAVDLAIVYTTGEPLAIAGLGLDLDGVVIAGNWKMNTTRADAVQLATAIAGRAPAGPEVVVFPPFPWLVPVAEQLRGSDVGLGAQDCWTDPNGAITGAVSPSMVAELCSHVILGHSERRRLFGETDELVRAKVWAARAHGLTPIVCVGEDLALRQAGEADATVSRQVVAVIGDRSTDELQGLVIAYEPIWAIGTGVAAEPSDAQAMARTIREVIRTRDATAADAIRVLYGGSVTAENSAQILACTDVDGALVGGASLQAESFLEIAAAAIR